MHAGRKRGWAQTRGGSGSEDDLDMRVGGADSDDDALEDVGSMSAQQLRSWLTARGADHELCEDQADLVRRSPARLARGCCASHAATAAGARARAAGGARARCR